MALQLRPNCEYCDKDLPPNATEARICTYECTFCADCVETRIHNVCPNCGGGFAKRPIRPAMNWKGSMFLGKYPASKTAKHRPVDEETHKNFVAAIRAIPPEDR